MFFYFHLKDFSGNAPLGGATEVINSLSPAIVAQFIRIYVRAFDHYTALRLEFKGFYKGMLSDNFSLCRVFWKKRSKPDVV